MLTTAVCAQNTWTVDRCISYAMEHNHDVRQRQLALADYRADRMEAVGAMLPTAEGYVGTQWNFGRAIDPETNAYTNVNTFYNSYRLQAALPVFDGMKRINQLKLAKANQLMGKYGVEAEKDNVAMKVFQAFVDVVYYHGTQQMAREKADESRMLLHQTTVMEEVGQKSAADVAQMEATLATDEYEVTRQQSLLENAMAVLKQLMNYPMADTLALDGAMASSSLPTADSALDIYNQALLTNPTIHEAELSAEGAKYQLRMAWSQVMPRLNVGAGISTTYYKTLGQQGYDRFSSQFHNNAGEYVYASLSIPLFTGLSASAAIRRGRNAVRKAQDKLEYQHAELQRIITQAVTDHRNALMEQEKMARKVDADSLAAQLTTRKYEEGQSSAIDVQTARATLLQSRALLLQCRLTAVMKERLVNYYRGNPIR